MKLEIGRIVATHPESGSVDAVLPIDGRRLTNVRVVSSSASSSSGSFNIPSPSMGSKSKDVARTPLGGLEMQGIFGFTEGGAVCLGFVFPHNSQMLFSDKNRSINRHPSGVYTTTDEHGNTEFVHPSGLFIRIGGSAEHDSLAGKSRDGGWSIGKTAPAYMTINQGKASLTIDPAGNISIKSAGNMSIDVSGTFDCKSGGNMSFTAPRIDLNK